MVSYLKHVLSSSSHCKVPTIRWQFRQCFHPHSPVNEMGALKRNISYRYWRDYVKCANLIMTLPQPSLTPRFIYSQGFWKLCHGHCEVLGSQKGTNRWPGGPDNIVTIFFCISCFQSSCRHHLSIYLRELRGSFEAQIRESKGSRRGSK